jgi:quercetin dioxygenase-like cupin family protein
MGGLNDGGRVIVGAVTAFDDLASVPPQEVWAGYLARAVHGEQLTLAVVEIEPGAGLPEHDHVNEQLGLVLRGQLHFRVGAEERTVGPGGIWRIASETPHSATAGPDGAVVVDVFSPPRDDWSAFEAEAPRPPVWP